jgi:hypothetical protein
VKVTSSPRTDGFLDDTSVVVVAFLSTPTKTVAVAGSWVASPRYAILTALGPAGSGVPGESWSLVRVTVPFVSVTGAASGTPSSVMLTSPVIGPPAPSGTAVTVITSETLSP